MLAVGSGSTPDEVLQTCYSAEAGYATPKVDVRGAVFQDDALLFVRERADGNRWTLPGGWADVGDTPSRNVEREVFEELGYQTRAVKVLAILDRRHHGHVPANLFHIYKVFFLCQLVGGAATTSVETEGAAFSRARRDSAQPLNRPRDASSGGAHLRAPLPSRKSQRTSIEWGGG